MRLPALLAAVPLMMAAAPVLATEAPSVAPGATLLTLTAEGRAVRAPDIATFSSGVATTGKTASEAMSANAAAMNKVIAALKRAGVADRDIQTSNLSLNPVYEDRTVAPGQPRSDAPPLIVGYQASNTVNVRARDIAHMGKVIDALVAAGANQVNGPDFSLDQPDAALDEARVSAMKSARARADLYARAAGLHVTRVLSISETGGFAPMPRVFMAKMAMADSAPTPVAGGEVATSVNVTVQYELAP